MPGKKASKGNDTAARAATKQPKRAMYLHIYYDENGKQKRQFKEGKP